ncbi:MAG: hypothetical protein JXB88_24105 [Spirochaetales bacterium]|nr:hypothetical protein [Spirochaetales bacterium]
MTYVKFRQEKEKKYGAKYCYSTSAQYLPQYPGTWKSVSGLLYFLESIVCFESFKNTNLFYNVLVREKFQKIEVEIPVNIIVAVTNGYGESSKIKTGFLKRFLRSFNTCSKLLLITVDTDTEKKTYAFSLLENPFIFCKKIKPFLPGSK